MKRLLPFLVVFTFCCAAWTQTTPSTSSSQTTSPAQGTVTAQAPTPSPQPQEKLLFPKDWYWGWAEFDLAPPHNEIDPNLCAANAGAPQYGGVNAPCSAFARYQIAGTIELRPFGRTIARRLMLFYDPNFLFGKNLPGVLYTWSWSGIGMEYKWGIGVDLPKRFQFRFTNHPTIQRFGSRDQPLGPAWLGANGPWGQYNTIGIRKYFGTRREGTD
ncbi:MAG TPA: hypothetical protein VKB58_12720 [Terriglobales bacterium]|jgi:hypothetical protein|nr:hypothetical protein [Terriglobales bacterium]